MTNKITQCIDRLKWKSKTDIYKAGYWINAKGEFVHFTDISEQYAQNILGVLMKIGEQKISDAIVTAYSVPPLGEMAEIALDSEIDYFENYADSMDWVQSHPFYPFLIGILEKEDDNDK